ncbi:MAG: hypothetical protein R2752_10965 [Vicinamibacterales bacterium]
MRTSLSCAALASLAILVGASACGSGGATAASGPAAPAWKAGAEAHLNGRAKGGIIAPVLNIWNTVPPTEAVCTLQHGVAVSVLESKYNQLDSRWYYRIEHGDCTGWVPESSLSK